MKLYAWQPKGHGEQSFFVMAKSENAARKAVRRKIAELITKGNDDDYWEDDGNYSEYDFKRYDTDYYRLTILNDGEVILNGND